MKKYNEWLHICSGKLGADKEAFQELEKKLNQEIILEMSLEECGPFIKRIYEKTRNKKLKEHIELFYKESIE